MEGIGIMTTIALRPQVREDYPYPFSAGPRRITNVLCPDGSQRVAYLSAAGADTFFSIPARVYVGRRTVAGYVTRETLEGFSASTEGDPVIYKFVVYKYGKNADAFPLGVTTYRKAVSA